MENIILLLPVILGSLLGTAGLLMMLSLRPGWKKCTAEIIDIACRTKKKFKSEISFEAPVLKYKINGVNNTSIVSNFNQSILSSYKKGQKVNILVNKRNLSHVIISENGSIAGIILIAAGAVTIIAYAVLIFQYGI